MDQSTDLRTLPRWYVYLVLVASQSLALLLVYANHLHTELLRYANNLIKTRDDEGLTTHIGKVKSRTVVTYDDEADKGACGVVDGETLPNITFTAADPP